MHGNTLITLM